jgi:hypothetical protein
LLEAGETEINSAKGRSNMGPGVDSTKRTMSTRVS